MRETGKKRDTKGKRVKNRRKKEGHRGENGNWEKMWEINGRNEGDCEEKERNGKKMREWAIETRESKGKMRENKGE